MRMKLTAALLGLVSLLAMPEARASGDTASPVQDWNCDGAINSFDLLLYETYYWSPGLPPWPLDPDGNPIYDQVEACVRCHEGNLTAPQELPTNKGGLMKSGCS